MRSFSGATLYLTAWYAPNPEPTEDHDASIGYTIAKRINGAIDVQASGEMLYASDKKTYDRIQDVKEDLVGYLTRTGIFEASVLLADETSLDPDDYV